MTSDDEYDTYSESDESESGSNNLECAELRANYNVRSSVICQVKMPQWQVKQCLF